MIPQLYRKRIIPNETVKLFNDEVVYCEDGIIVTKWKPIKPRQDIGGGESCYIIDKGIKVSRFYDSDNNFIYWYCDIIETTYIENTNEYIFTDLLADVKVLSNGDVKVLDIDEIVPAFEDGVINIIQLKYILNKLSVLLDIVYGDGLNAFCGNYFELFRQQPADNNK